MKSLAGLLLALCAVVTMTPASVQASSHGIPAAAYPPGAHIGYRPVLTNAEMDCMWGFVCDGPVPNFHFVTQDDLHRTDGWAEFAGAQLDGGRMVFALFASTYAPGWSRQAYEDLIVTTENQGYAAVPGLATHPSIAGGESMAELQPNGRFDLVVMAAWTGTHEVEGLADFAHNSRARHDALRYLRHQLHVALSQR
jgi:hypothetical protein